MSDAALTRRALLAIAGVSVVRLSNAAEPRIVVPGYNTFTDEEEVQLGRAFDRKLKEEARFVEDPTLANYLSDLIHRIGATSRRPNFRYSIRVIDVAEVNAFAIPGGFIYVNRGLLDLVQNESELVGALAHEVGHVAAHHGTNKLAAIFIGKSFYELVKREVLRNNEVVANVIEKVGGALFILAQLQYSRSNEADADSLGYYNMMRAGWHPDGMVSMFHRLLAHSGDPNFVEAIFSSHPPTSERIHAIEQEMHEAPPDSRLVRDSGQFQQVKEIVHRLPSPKMRSMPH